RVSLSNLDKVLYPATGTTKGEVLHYYAATVGGVILPHLRERPVSFLRYPDGPGGQVFFTKNPPPGTPA
ncbi:ATP-dependent DNA ligase, partial [Streptomyces sp. SID7499]|nr:ATP-dependent DNA ligase [Streptomyces sp. SID7499]